MHLRKKVPSVLEKRRSGAAKLTVDLSGNHLSQRAPSSHMPPFFFHSPGKRSRYWNDVDIRATGGGRLVCLDSETTNIASIEFVTHRELTEVCRKISHDSDYGICTITLFAGVSGDSQDRQDDSPRSSIRG